MSHVRKSKLVEQRFEQYGSRLVSAADAEARRGRWRESLGCSNGRFVVDLGCGKGLWLSRLAAAQPDVALLGIDNVRTCVSFALERAAEADAANVALMLAGADELGRFFASGEIDALHLNFPTPFPRKKEAGKRVTCAARLMEYRPLLAPGAHLHLKTDSQPLFDFTLEQLERAGYRVVWQTRDLHGGYVQPAASPEEGPDAADLVPSAYEEKLVGKGAAVLALHAVAGPAPAAFDPGEPVGLVQYLPDDLESLAYAPHGMEDTVANLRNRARNAAERANR